MFAKWGAAVAAVTLSGAALFGLTHAAQAQEAGQPTLPSPPPDAPTVDIPLPTGGGGIPSIVPTKPSSPLPPGTGPVPLLPQSVNIALKVERDGLLSVREQVFVQARKTMTRRQPLRIQAGDIDRVFTVRNIEVRGKGSAEVTGDELVMELGEGASTVSYTVEGAVTNTGDHQEVRWQVAGGWDVTVRSLRASFVAPEPPSNVECLAGRRGSEEPCSQAITDSGQVLRVEQQDLRAGDRVDLAVSLPAGTVGGAGDAEFDDASASAFALTPVSGIGLGVLALVLAGGFVLLWLARGRDARALAADVGPVELLVTDGGRVAR